MALIDQVKPRLGVFYSDTNKDAEIQGMIDEAVLFYKDAGWEFGPTPDAKAVGAVIRYCSHLNKAEPSDPANDPCVWALVGQARGVV